jgi:predicted kinase
MVGIPASGKSTWLRNRGVGHVVSMDVIRLELAGDMGDQRRNDEVFHMAICALKRSLASVSDVAFDATNIDRDARRVPLEAAAARGARVTAVFLDTPFRVCASRNAARRRRVPVDVVLRFAQRLVPPMPYECDDRLVISCT